MGTFELESVLRKKNVLIPYYTFGDPDTAFTEKLIIESIKAGAEVIELGIPFSDPIADGPVIQASHQRALENGEDVSIKKALETVKKIKKDHAKTPFIFMSDVNLVLQYGIEVFFKDAKENGLDGIIIPDLTVSHAKEYIQAAKENEIALIFLISPLATEERIKETIKESTGFIYLIASTGTTGERQSVSAHLPELVKKIKSQRDIPLVVGFGISTPEHLKTVHTFAEGGIVGSHLVKMIETASSKEEALQTMTERIKAFKA